MKKIIIHHNTGFGDHLICNGLVNFISLEKKVYLICNSKNYISVKYLYIENKNVIVLPIFRNNKIEQFLLKAINLLFKKPFENAEKLLSLIYSKIARIEILYIGFDDVTWPEWDKSFYLSSGLNFNIRYEYFKLPPTTKNSIQNIPKDFILVQDTSSQGKYELEINSEKEKIYLDPKRTKNFFDNLPYVNGASEIHCIDSALVHLVEGVSPKKNQELFFHDVERYNQLSVPDARFNMRHKWKIIKYKESSSFY